jgi:hypothetical protein
VRGSRRLHHLAPPPRGNMAHQPVDQALQHTRRLAGQLPSQEG